MPIATFLVGIFLGAALVKPWDLFFPAPTPAIAQRPTGLGERRPIAQSVTDPAARRVRVRGRLAGLRARRSRTSSAVTGRPAWPGPATSPVARTDIGNPLRRWLEVDPLETASGPGDQRIPFVTIVSDRIAGIGYCPPPDGSDGPPADARFDAWRLDAAGTPAALALHRATLGTTSTIRVPVYIGADPPAGAFEHWPAGRYIFAVEGLGPRVLRPVVRGGDPVPTRQVLQLRRSWISDCATVARSSVAAAAASAAPSPRCSGPRERRSG